MLQVLKILDQSNPLKVERRLIICKAWRGLVGEILRDLEVTKCLRDPKHLDLSKLKQEVKSLLCQNNGEFAKLQRILGADEELMDLGLIASEISRSVKQKSREFGLDLEQPLQPE